MTEDRRNIEQYLYGFVFIALTIVHVAWACKAIEILRRHKNSGETGHRLKSLLIIFIGIYLSTAACELGGTILIAYTFIQPNGLTTRLRQVCIIVRTTQNI